MAEPHPLSVLLRDAARGRFPTPDGTIQVFPPPPGPVDAVVAFTAHNVIAADVDQGEILQRLPRQDPGAPMSAEFLAWLATRLGTHAGMLDMVMVAPDPDPEEELPELIRQDDLVDHPRLARSRRFRTDLRCYTDVEDRALVVVGRGLAERWEMGLEVKPAFRRSGLGTMLARAVARVAPSGELLFAQVTPGNVASVRAFLAAGYRPICSEVLFLRTGSDREPGPTGSQRQSRSVKLGFTRMPK